MLKKKFCDFEIPIKNGTWRSACNSTFLDLYKFSI